MTTKVKECTFHKGVPASENLSNGLLKPLWVCGGCYTRFLDANAAICKFCGVLMKSHKNIRPLRDNVNFNHRKDCPRHGISHQGDPIHPEEKDNEH